MDSLQNRLLARRPAMGALGSNGRATEEAGRASCRRENPEILPGSGTFKAFRAGRTHQAGKRSAAPY
jgi:hypothetical protein